MSDLLNEILFIFQRLDWQSLLDLFLVTAILFGVLILLRDTQATVLLRGVVFLVIFLALLINFVELPAFSWLIDTTLPALLLAIPVIFAPEIRRGLERIGRASATSLFRRTDSSLEDLQITFQAIATSCARLSARKHGALIILERTDPLVEYISTGIYMDSAITPELMMQIFYPNTPLHDGGVIISKNRILAASCVMPLSASGVLNRSSERRMGLRHRAALGTSEATDAIVIIVSEETGKISIAQGGRMIRGVESNRLVNLLLTFYRPTFSTTRSVKIFGRKFNLPQRKNKEVDRL